MYVGTRVTGLAQATRDLRGLGADVDDLKDAFASIANQGAVIAASHVNSKSGRLANDVRGNRALNKAVVIAGRASVKYAGPQNYGWPKRNIRAQGFMQKADKELQPIALGELEKEIDTRIRKRGLNQ